MTLKAVAFSVKSGGDIQSVTVGGSLRTEGADVVTFEVADGGSIAALEVGGAIEAKGAGSRTTDIQGTVPTSAKLAAAE